MKYGHAVLCHIFVSLFLSFLLLSGPPAALLPPLLLLPPLALIPLHPLHRCHSLPTDVPIHRPLPQRMTMGTKRLSGKEEAPCDNSREASLFSFLFSSNLFFFFRGHCLLLLRVYVLFVLSLFPSVVTTFFVAPSLFGTRHGSLLRKCSSSSSLFSRTVPESSDVASAFLLLRPEPPVLPSPLPSPSSSPKRCSSL